MPTPILMPALSPTMEEGTLAKWNIKEGDKVSSGDVIAEIETDKATMEVEAVDEGVVGKIVVPAGTEGVKVNETIAILLEDGESAGDLKAEAPKNGGAKPEEPKKNGSFAPPRAGELSAKRTEGASVSAAPPPSAAPTPPPRAGEEKSGGARVFASPLAKRIAKMEGVDLAALKGSGPQGRVVKRDIEKAIASGGAPKAADAPQAAFVPLPLPSIRAFIRRRATRRSKSSMACKTIARLRRSLSTVKCRTSRSTSTSS
ncbi:MAG: biotin/lipoyl-containing protein [Parvularculaceae bacterium]